MQLTRHCELRSQHRGIRPEQIEAVIAKGLLIGDDIYWMPRSISPREDLNNLVVVAGGSALITTYRAGRRDQRRLTRRARLKGVA